ncbi:MAG: LamG-like jellyroll fold domain-containing protein [Bacteroidota bacterium]
MKSVHHFLKVVFVGFGILFSLSAVSHSKTVHADILQPDNVGDTLYQVVLIGQSQAGGYAPFQGALSTVPRQGIYTLTDGPLDSRNDASSNLIPLVEGDVNDNNGNDPNTETSVSGILIQAMSSSNCNNCQFLGTVAYRNGIPLTGLLKGRYGHQFGWGQLRGDFVRGYNIAQDSGWIWQPILVLHHGGGGGNPYGGLVTQLKKDFRFMVDSLEAGTTGYFIADQQREIGNPDYGIDILLALDTVENADVVFSRTNAVEVDKDNIHLTNWGQRHAGVYFGHHIGRKFIAGEDFETGLRIGTHYWDGSKLIIPILNSVGALVGTGDHDIEIYNQTNNRVENGTFSISGTNLEFTFNNNLQGSKEIVVRTDRGSGMLRDSRGNSLVNLENRDGSPYVLHQYLLRYNYRRTIDFRGGTQTLNTFSHSVNNGGNVNYYMYFPNDFDFQKSNRPILISLHGYGEFFGGVGVMLGEDGEGSIAKLANEGTEFPLMVASLRGKFLDINGKSTIFWNVELVKQFRDYLISEYQVDPNRIFVTGYSAGATAAWEYASRYPEDVAALVPLAGKTNLSNLSEFGFNLQNGQYACPITPIPTRAFHGQADNLIPSYETTRMVNAINNCNPSPDPKVEMNVLSGIDHGTLRSAVYTNVTGADNIYSWMLQFDKGRTVVDETPPFFIGNTPIVENITSSGFDLRVSLNELGKVYYASYASGYTPSIQQIIDGAGPNLIFSGASSLNQQVSISIGGLEPQTNYSLWLVAEDDAAPENIQPAATELSVRTLFIADTDPPIPPSGFSSTASTEAVSLSWQASHSDDVAFYNVHRLDSAWDAEGQFGLTDPYDTIQVHHSMDFENGLNDLSGNGVYSSLENGATVQDIFSFNGSGALLFDGNNDFIDLDLGSEYILGNFNQRSISLWAFPTSTSGVRDLYDEGGSTNGIGLRINNGSIEGVVQNAQVIRSISASIAANQWSHISLTFDQGDLRLYVNGVLSAFDADVPFPTVNDHSDAGGLGGTNGSNAFDLVSSNYAGYIDDFIVTGNVLTPNLIGDYYRFFQPLAVVSVPNTQYSDNSLTVGQEVAYFITAVDTAGNISATSELISASLSTIELPDGPSNLEFDLTNDSTVVLNWEEVSDPTFTNYSIYRSGSSFSLLSQAQLLAEAIETPFYTDQNLESARDYYYGVVAVDAEGDKTKLSNVVKVSTRDRVPPSLPENFAAISDGFITSLSWDESVSQDVAGYNIYKSTEAFTNVESEFLIGSTDEGSTAFSDVEIEEGLLYFYALTVIDTAGNESTGRYVSTIVPNITPPSAPANVSLVAGTSELTINWSESISPDVSSYRIFRLDSSEQQVDDPILENPLDQIDKLHYLKFDGNAADASGNGVNSILVGGTSFQSSVAIEGSSGQFDGDNDHLDLDVDNQYLNKIFTQRSISLWIYPLATTGWIDIYNEGGSTNGIALRISEGRIEAAAQNQQVIRAIISDPIVPNDWTHVALVFDNGTLQLFINGSLSDSDQNLPFTAVNNHVSAGGLGKSLSGKAFDDNRANFHGYIDEFIVTGNAISSPIISQYFQFYRPTQITAPSVDTLLISEVSHPETFYSDENVSDSLEYRYYVTAVDTSGNQSVPSAIVSGKLVEEIFVPSIPTNLNAEFTGLNQVLITWDAVTTAGFSEYELYGSLNPFSDTNEASLLAGGLIDNEYEVDQLLSATTYYYAVLAKNILGEASRLSTIISVTTSDFEAPEPPMNFSAALDGSAIELAWESSVSQDIASYRIYKNVGNAPLLAQDFLMAAPTVDLLAFNDAEVEESFEYFYLITAIDTAGNESVGSELVSLFVPDVTAPVVPSGFSADLGTEEVILSWDPSPSADLEGYSIWKSELGTIWPDDFSLLVSNIESTTFSDTFVESASTYFYAVSAQDTVGNASGISQILTVFTPDIEAPEAPENLGLIAQVGALLVSWDASASADVDQYFIYKAEGEQPLSSLDYFLDSVEAAIQEFTDFEVLEGVQYSYMVTAVDASGNESEATSIAVGTPINTLPPSVPSGFTAEVNAVNEVLLSWTANQEIDFEEYLLWRSDSDFSTTSEAINLVSQGLTSYLDLTVLNDAGYYYAIQARDVVGNVSELSSTVFIQTADLVPPAIPKNLTVVVSGSSLVLGWLSGEDEDLSGYRVYGGVMDNLPSEVLAVQLAEVDTTAFPMYSFDLSVADEGIEYFFAVSGVDDAGNESGISEIVGGSLPNVTPPGVPEGLQLSLVENSIVFLDWEDHSAIDFESFSLYRSETFNFGYDQNTLIASGLTESSYADEDLQFETTYYYAVIAVDEADNASEPSATQSIQTSPEPPSGPVLLSILSPEASFNIFPIPSKDGRLTINGEFPNERNVDITITDGTGRTLYQTTFDSSINESIELDVEPGIYYLRLLGRDVKVTRRIVISK